MLAAARDHVGRLLLERLRKAQTNIEFLMQVQKTTPAPGQTD